MTKMGKGGCAGVKDIQTRGGADPDFAGLIAYHRPDDIRTYGVLVVRLDDEWGEKVAFLVVAEESFSSKTLVTKLDVSPAGPSLKTYCS